MRPMGNNREYFISQVKKKFINNGWITVYDNDDIYCGLAKEECANTMLGRSDWEIHLGNIGVDIYGDGRYVSGTDCDVTPFVYRRFDPDDIEILQEFRLLYNLRTKTVVGGVCYYGKDASGDECEVVRQVNKQVLVRLPFLKEFIAYKKRNLVLYFDTRLLAINAHTIDPLKRPLDTAKDYNGDDYIYQHTIIPCEDVGQGVDWVMGKCLLRYNQTDIKNLWEWPDEGFEDFIVGYNNNGEEIEHTCDKDHLSNYFVQKGNEPLEITPVYFRKEVLDRYYGNPNKYTVSDGMVQCDKYWSIKIDNDRNKYVVAILVDLGMIPYKEQKYWKTYNVAPPINAKLSNTANERWMNGQFCETSVAPDLVFKQEFESFAPKWKEHFGWDLFLPLTEGDKHRYKSLHFLTTQDNDSDFEEQVLSITKLIIDSLNEKELSKGIDKTLLKDNAKGIEKFTLWAKEKNIILDDEIEFLHSLQSLRSQDVAHRKSSNESKRKDVINYFHLDTKNKQEILDDIFNKATAFLKKLIDSIDSNPNKL